MGSGRGVWVGGIGIAAPVGVAGMEMAVLIGSGVWANVGGEGDDTTGSTLGVEVDGAQADKMSKNRIIQRGMPSLLKELGTMWWIDFIEEGLKRDEKPRFPIMR